MTIKNRPEFEKFISRVAKSSDELRASSTEKRHTKQYRTARENLHHLIDEDTFLEFGQFAVAAQRSRRDYEELQDKTNADGIITGFCSINSALVGEDDAKAVAIVYDYSVLAGTQGFFHHAKLDRICEQAKKFHLPVIIFTEGGGGRPGDTDVLTQIAGLHIPSFSSWAQLTGTCLKIAVNNGYCFAGNAVLFGCADFKIATKDSWIGMAGPAMIEGGGLGTFAPKEIGPIDVQQKNGVVDYVAENEEEATIIAKQLLSYFQGPIEEFTFSDQGQLREMMPDDRRYTYEVRDIIGTIADADTFLELRNKYGKSIVTGFIRIEGKPFALLASDCQQLGGAIDSESAEKAGEFISICNDHQLPILVLADTPGFMVGPASEQGGAVRRMSSLLKHGANLSVPLVAIFLRKGYGLGAQALVGGSLHNPVYTAAWPTGEFGAMGIEGAVKLGYKKELEEMKDEDKRKELFDKLVSKMYEVGQAVEAASFLEIDAVIDPADTRMIVIKAFNTSEALL
jgi:acetyl-CoA carboxylase carboxyltransferase component